MRTFVTVSRVSWVRTSSCGALRLRGLRPGAAPQGSASRDSGSQSRHLSTRQQQLAVAAPRVPRTFLGEVLQLGHRSESAMQLPPHPSRMVPPLLLTAALLSPAAALDSTPANALLARLTATNEFKLPV